MFVGLHLMFLFCLLGSDYLWWTPDTQLWVYPRSKSQKALTSLFWSPDGWCNVASWCREAKAAEARNRVTPAQKVLILGSGYVSAPVVEYLTRNEKYAVTIGKRSEQRWWEKRIIQSSPQSKQYLYWQRPVETLRMFTIAVENMVPLANTLNCPSL